MDDPSFSNEAIELTDSVKDIMDMNFGFSSELTDPFATLGLWLTVGSDVPFEIGVVFCVSTVPFAIGVVFFISMSWS